MSDQPKVPETSREAAAEIIRWMNVTSSSDVPVYSYLVQFLEAYAAKIAAGAYAASAAKCFNFGYVVSRDPFHIQQDILALRTQDAIDAWDTAMEKSRLAGWHQGLEDDVTMLFNVIADRPDAELAPDAQALKAAMLRARDIAMLEARLEQIHKVRYEYHHHEEFGRQLFFVKFMDKEVSDLERLLVEQRRKR